MASGARGKNAEPRGSELIVDALILAGGLGTRLASVVKDRAKPVADIGGRPFLAFVLDHLATLRELRRVILCVGHKATSVESSFGARFGRLAIEYSREDKPLGTGGALRRACERYDVRAPALALNGDTYFPLPLDRLVGFHRMQRAAATVAVARMDDSTRYGSVRIVGSRIAAVEEKAASGTGWINAGVYVLGRGAIIALAEAKEVFSLEREVLPLLAAAGTLAAFRSRSRFVDIGIPEDYARAKRLLAR